jgi:hypothetical protein
VVSEVEKLSKGLYLLQVKTLDANTTIKVVKQ